MTSVLLVLEEPRASRLREELRREGVDVQGVVAAHDVVSGPLDRVDAVIVSATRRALSVELVSACDRNRVRIVVLGAGDARALACFGLPEPLPSDAEAWQIADALAQDVPRTLAPPPAPQRRLLAVWGAQGAPGRSTVAIQLAVELSRAGRSSALVDADTVAPAIALLLGLGDESPGIAAACRRAELGGLDAAELTRLASPVETSAGVVQVLAGLNRPSRWPELSARRLRLALEVCRDWVDTTVVDVAGAFEADEEVSDDVTGPRRHAATTAALQLADTVIAVTSCDPLSISRFVRDHAEVRRIVGPSTPILVVANRMRPGPLGVDARRQVRSTLERYAGIDDVVFVPWDQRAADAALLHARPMADVTPRAAAVAAIRRLVAALGADGPVSADTRDGVPTVTDGSRPGSSRGVRWPRSAPAARAASPRAGDRASAS